MGKSSFFKIKKLQCHKMKEIGSAVSSTSRTLTALSSIWTGSLMSFQKMEVRSPDSKITLYWSLQSGSSNQYRRFPWEKHNKRLWVSQSLSQQVPQISIYLAGLTRERNFGVLPLQTSFWSEIKQFQLLDAGGWELITIMWTFKVFWWCLILILSKKSLGFCFLKKNPNYCFFHQTIYQATGNKHQSLPQAIKNIKRCFWKYIFKLLVQNYYSLLNNKSKLSFTLCVTIKHKNQVPPITAWWWAWRNSSMWSALLFTTPLTHSFYFHMDISAMKQPFNIKLNILSTFPKIPYQILKWLFLRDFPLVTDCHVPERAIWLVTLHAGTQD